MINLFAAGTDTTGNTLQWCLLYMAKYPHIQGAEIPHQACFNLHELKKRSHIVKFDLYYITCRPGSGRAEQGGWKSTSLCRGQKEPAVH